MLKNGKTYRYHLSLVTLAGEHQRLFNLSTPIESLALERIIRDFLQTHLSTEAHITRQRPAQIPPPKSIKLKPAKDTLDIAVKHDNQDTWFMFMGFAFFYGVVST